MMRQVVSNRRQTFLGVAPLHPIYSIYLKNKKIGRVQVRVQVGASWKSSLFLDLVRLTLGNVDRTRLPEMGLGCGCKWGFDEVHPGNLRGYWRVQRVRSVADIRSLWQPSSRSSIGPRPWVPLRAWANTQGASSPER